MILLTLFIDMQAGEISTRTVACISIRSAITTYHQFGTWQSLYINSIINYSEIALYTYAWDQVGPSPNENERHVNSFPHWKTKAMK